jgi:PiT family inorganic phosphate transporter
MLLILFFLSSGLFLGWSLGANDAANVFGTAVGTRMVRFKTAATVCSIFVILGAVVSGAGASHTLGKLGSINEMSGAFIVALAAALSVFWMTKSKLPVSTSQAIVGAIIGWNFFSGSITEAGPLIKIVSTWFICPILAGIFSYCLFWVVKFVLDRAKIHIFRLDAYTRFGLFLAGAFGSYSLGANNIANVMGVFVPVSPFKSVPVSDLFVFSSSQQLFLLGGIAIAVGVFTYSRRVMETVGKGIFKLSPISAFVVVLSSSLVLFLFASQELKNWLTVHGLPSLPLVPVSSSQAVVGAVLGIGLAKSRHNIHLEVLGRIGLGWVVTPVIAGIVSFTALFFMQNVFSQKVYQEVSYQLSSKAVERMNLSENQLGALSPVVGKIFDSEVAFDRSLKKIGLDKSTRIKLFFYGEIRKIEVSEELLSQRQFVEKGWFSRGQVEALRELLGSRFQYKWEVMEALGQLHTEWRFKIEKVENKAYNKSLKESYRRLFRLLQ